MVKTSSGDRSPLLQTRPRRCCRDGEGGVILYFASRCRIDENTDIRIWENSKIKKIAN